MILMNSKGLTSISVLQAAMPIANRLACSIRLHCHFVSVIDFFSRHANGENSNTERERRQKRTLINMILMSAKRTVVTTI